MRRLILLLITGLVLALSAGVATAASGGSLTSFEYQQLVTARDRLKAVKSVSAAIWDCQQIQMQTQLLNAERSDCISQFQLVKVNGVMKSYEADCIAYRTAAARLRCLLPGYRQFYATVATFYHSESHIRQIAISRDLGEPCTDLLSDKPLVISEEKLAVEAIASIIRAAEAGNLLTFESESGKAITALADVAKGQQANDGPPSICRHQ